MPITGYTPYNSFVPGEPWVIPGQTLSGDHIDARFAGDYFADDPALPTEVAVAGST